MGIKVSVSGVDILLKGLDDFSKEIQNKVAEEAKDWAYRVESAAQRDVPVDTGMLKGTIRAVLGANGLTWIVKAGGINGVDYAPYANFGTGSYVDEAFLQRMGLVAYARQFMGKGERQVNLPMRDFLYRNAQAELLKTVEIIRKFIATDDRARELRK